MTRREEILQELYSMLKDKPTQEVWDRFMEKVDIPNWGSCWEWKAGLDTHGYGGFWLSRTQRQAHRQLQRWLHGDDFPAVLTCDHLCKNPPCVNPIHIELVTLRENTLRGDTITAKNLQKTHCPQGHPYSEENTHIYYDMRTCRSCARVRVREYRRRVKARKAS